MRKKKGRKGAIVFKIYLHKAFDNVDWDFRRKVLVDFNIPVLLIPLIMFLVTSLQLSILWNGEELPSNHNECRVAFNSWKPFHISRGGLALLHLFFVNDLMLFYNACLAQVEMVMECLNEFAGVSGLDINLSKSNMRFLWGSDVANKPCLVSWGTHTLRECNLAADCMVAIGHSLPQGLTLFPSLPAGIRSILHEDNIGTLFLRT
ncbi:hypothetical protein SLA2020_207990 [Shorea laevis]